MVIYGVLRYQSKGDRGKRGLKFDYVDEHGKSMRMEKKSWMPEPLSPNPFEVLRQLSWEGWECFSVITISRQRNWYYLRKNVERDEMEV